MNLNLQSMVDAFERTSLDERLFLIVKSEDELDICVEFNRADQLRCWTFSFRDMRDESSQRCSRNHFTEVAKAFRINETFLAKELAGHLLTQAAFADQFVREIQELLGQEAVRESILRTQNFMDALKEAVSSALGEAKTSAHSGGENDDIPPTVPQPAPHGLKLRVIKGS